MRDSQLGIVIDLNLLLAPRRGVSDVELQRNNGDEVSEAAEIKETRKKGEGQEGGKHAFMAPRSEGAKGGGGGEGLAAREGKREKEWRVRLLKPETLNRPRDRLPGTVLLSHYLRLPSFEVRNGLPFQPRLKFGHR